MHNITYSYTFVIGVCDRTKPAVDKTKAYVILNLGTSSYHEDITFYEEDKEKAVDLCDCDEYE